MGRPKIDVDAVSDATFAVMLEKCADDILRTDGDRDYMNTSNLTVQATTALADLLRLAALKLSRESDYQSPAHAEGADR